MHHEMEMMAQAQRQSMLEVSSSGSTGCTALRAATTRLGWSCVVFLLNKCNGTAEKVRLVLPKPAASSITVVTLADTAAADVQGSERWGTVQHSRQLVCVIGVCEFKLPPLSFSVVAA